MTAAFEFTGPEPAAYAFGVAKPGDVARFTYPPDGNWREVAEPGAPELRRPNKAAAAADWVAYAQAEGSFPGDPEAATRKAIVDHYTEPVADPAPADAPPAPAADGQEATQ